jgi:hypothetical protein
MLRLTKREMGRRVVRSEERDGEIEAQRRFRDSGKGRLRDEETK